MSYKINWKSIKNGYKGFEELALKYVQMEIDENFAHTNDTRDGNKDAVLEKDVYTIILGYQASSNSVEEWWMEAKYSESKDIIPRYRLDATLVSAILKGTVGRIIFVTNMNIPSQTVNDIRQAVIGVTVCKEVNFCTRNTLEYWLYQNPSILGEFFSDHVNEIIELDNLILIDNIKYYADQEISYSYKEDLRILDLEETYRANFTVYSNCIQTLTVQSDSNLCGIKILHSKKIYLQKGINNIEISFLLKSNYGYKSIKKQKEHLLLPEPAFRVGNLPIISENNVIVNKQISANLEIPSQKKAAGEISAFFAKSGKTKGTYLFYLHGQNGVGKKRVINNYIRSEKRQICPCFFCEITGDYQQDLVSLVDCINYIYFPFLPSDGITVEYLDCIDSNNYFPAFYREIIASRDNEMQLNHSFFKYISENIMLFPRKIYINQRQIIIVNINKANTTIINVLYKIIIEQAMLDAPFRFILSGQWVQHTSLYSKLCTTVHVQELELRITVDDCIRLLPGKLPDEQLRIYLNSNQLFTNIIELLMFSIYLHDNNKDISDFETFQMMYHLFFRENVMDLYVKRIIDNAISNDARAMQLCNQVYWNIHGMNRTNAEEERKLLCYHVVRLDPTGCKVLPYHDIYARCYRKNYVYQQLSNVPFLQLLEFGNYSDIQSVAHKLHNEYIKKNYILVYYTLEPLFKNISDVYRNLMDDTTYFTLFLDFAHSCTLCSIDYSGGKLFQQIYDATKSLYNPAPQIQLVHNAALWELTNSTFEALNYSCALKRCEELLEDTKRLATCGIADGDLQDSVRYHNANVIKCLIKSEMQETDSEEFYQSSIQQMDDHKKGGRLWSFKVRYSLTLMQREPYRALDLLRSCRAYYKALNNLSEKYYLWSCFYIAYMQMILTTDDKIRHQEEVTAFSTLEKLRDMFFNDYRKMLYGMALYLYYCGKKDEADMLLLKDCYVLREKRPRLRGFEQLTFALRYILENNYSAALEKLNEAHNIFGHIPSYAALITHNIELIKLRDEKANSYKIQYYLGEAMENDTYYLDIRGCW